MKIVLFGTGMASGRLMSYKLRQEHEIVAVVDNNRTKWGENFSGYIIESPDAIKQRQFDIVLVAVINGWMDVRDQLREMGVAAGRIQIAVGWSRLDYYDDELDEIFVVPKRKFVQLGGAIHTLGHCGGETGKAKPRREREGFFEKYCNGRGLDIGCGKDPVVDGCYGWDLENGDAQYLENVENESFDFVYSSHCIEHMDDVQIAIRNWFRVVKKGGFLIIYGPQRDLYEKQRSLPSRFNPHHKHMFLVGKAEKPDTLDIVDELRQALVGQEYMIEYVRTCHDGYKANEPGKHAEGEYSFELVVRKA